MNIRLNTYWLTFQGRKIKEYTEPFTPWAIVDSKKHKYFYSVEIQYN